MTKKIWKMCVVGLILAVPVVCIAMTVPNAMAIAGDGWYVRMDPGSSITVNFGTDAAGNPIQCFGEDPAVILNLAPESSGLRVEFYSGESLLSYNDIDGFPVTFVETGNTMYTDWGVYWLGVPFDSVKITVYGTAPVYLDAVQGSLTQGGALVGGIYVTHTGSVSARKLSHR